MRYKDNTIFLITKKIVFFFIFFLLQFYKLHFTSSCHAGEETDLRLYIRSTTSAIAPSPVTLQAVPKLSIVI